MNSYRLQLVIMISHMT